MSLPAIQDGDALTPKLGKRRSPFRNCRYPLSIRYTKLPLTSLLLKYTLPHVGLGSTKCSTDLRWQPMFDATDVLDTDKSSRIVWKKRFGDVLLGCIGASSEYRSDGLVVVSLEIVVVCLGVPREFAIFGGFWRCENEKGVVWESNVFRACEDLGIVLDIQCLSGRLHGVDFEVNCFWLYLEWKWDLWQDSTSYIRECPRKSSQC